MKPAFAALGLGGVLAAAGLGLAGRGTPGVAAAPAPATLCARREEVVYSCPFARGIASVCAGGGRAFYRFGKPGKLDINLGNAPDWSNVHQGTVVGNGGGSESHIRFTNGQTHYVLFYGEMGNLSDHPGRRMSGIDVSQGVRGEKHLANMDCKVKQGTTGVLDLSLMPEGPDDEERDGPFDAWY